MRVFAKTAIAALVAAIGMSVHATAVSAAAIYSGGHGDLGVAYEDPGEFFVHAHVGAGSIVDGAPLDDEEEYTGDQVIIHVPSGANVGRNNVTLTGSGESYDFTAASYDFLGTAVGQDLWLLFPDAADASFYGGPHFGMAANEGIIPADWAGSSFPFTLTGFSGPGEMSMFTSTGTRRWDTQDDDFANDTLNLTQGSHGHFFWGFTAPGLYEVELTITGTHNVDGFVTGTETFFFQVGDFDNAGVPEPSSFALMGLAAVAIGVPALKRWRKRRQSTVG